MIKVILLADLPPHGQQGEVVSLPPGFAYNFLLKKHLAAVATPAILRQREQQHTTLPFNLMVNHAGQAQGEITARQILQKLALTIGAVDHATWIADFKPIRAHGHYELRLRLSSLITARLKISVTAPQ